MEKSVGSRWLPELIDSIINQLLVGII